MPPFFQNGEPMELYGKSLYLQDEDPELINNVQHSLLNAGYISVTSTSGFSPIYILDKEQTEFYAKKILMSDRINSNISSH